VLILNLLVFTASFVTYILSKDNRILFVDIGGIEPPHKVEFT